MSYGTNIAESPLLVEADIGPEMADSGFVQVFDRRQR